MASDVTGLAAWIASRGGTVSDKLELFHQMESGDRGVFATADIAEGEQLMIIPTDATIHLPSAEEFAKWVLMV
jgi:hypothetical protein